MNHERTVTLMDDTDNLRILEKRMREGQADEAARLMREDAQLYLTASVEALIEQHPVLLTMWSGQGFPLTPDEFAGQWLADVSLSTKLAIEAEYRRGRAA